MRLGRFFLSFFKILSLLFGNYIYYSDICRAKCFTIYEQLKCCPIIRAFFMPKMPILKDDGCILFPILLFELARFSDSFGDGEISAAVFLYFKMPNESLK